MFLERPAASYSFKQSEGRATTAADSTYAYHTVLEYKLGTFSLFKMKPFESFSKSENVFLKALSKTEFEPWPQTFDVTLFDMNYVRYIDNKLLLGARAELPLDRYGFGLHEGLAAP